jgi:hypothetical protein
MYPARDSHGPFITDEPDDAALLASIAQFNALEHRIDGFYEPNDPLYVKDDRDRAQHSADIFRVLPEDAA